MNADEIVNISDSSTGIPDGKQPVFRRSEARVSLVCNELSAEDRLKSCDPKVALAAAEEIINNPESLNEPLQLFPSVTILFRNGKKDEAVFWFYAAQLRVRYQLAFENGDRGQLLMIMLMTVGPLVNNYAFKDVSNLNRILDRVLEWDTKTLNPFQEKTRSKNTEKQITEVYVQLRELKAKLLAEKSELEAKARIAAVEIERLYAPKDNPLCRKGQLDPAYAAQETRKEWSLVTDFVKNNAEVNQEAGVIKEIFPESSTMIPTEVMPNRYILFVDGDRKIHAVVNVGRSEGVAKFTLACVTHLSMGKRDPFKDVCEQ